MNDVKENKMQLKVPLAKPWMSEEEAQAAAEVVRSGWLIFGPKVKEFEKRFAEKMDAKHAIAVFNGSIALLLAQQALGVKAGDECISPDMTFVSTATSCMYLGGKPVIADINLNNYCIDIDDMQRRTTDKTKVILPVHYAGHSADMKEIMEFAREKGLFVCEDAAEAHLAEYDGKKVGTIGDIGIFSFTPSKPMTTGEGGMIVTNDDELAEKCRLMRNYGDTDKFKWDTLGFNFRMSEVQGAIGLGQLAKLDEVVRLRRKIAHAYNDEFSAFDAIVLPPERTPKDINFQLYTIRLMLDKLTISRDDFISEMLKRGVSTRLYYPTLHDQGVFRDIVADANYPNTIEYAKTAVSLPIYPTMTDEELSTVAGAVKDVMNSFKR